MRQVSFGILALVLLATMHTGLMAQRRQPPRERPNGAARRDVRSTGLLKMGDVAPDFTLTYKGSDQMFTLSSYKSDKPVALVFGSYT